MRIYDLRFTIYALRLRFAASGIFAAFVVLMVLNGCAVGPSYKAPKTAVPAAFANGAQTNLNAEETVVAWWRGFNDPELDQLVERARAGNHDLRIATANLLQSRALRRQAQFDLGPVVNGVGSYSHSLASKD